MSHSPGTLRSMASHASLRSTASRQTFETAATRGLCFCGEPISPSLAPTCAHGDDDAYASDDEEDAPIYCSVSCARADALQALLAGSAPASSSSLAAPAMEASLSTDSASTCGPLTPTNATFALPLLPSAPTQLSATAAKRESRARVLHRASVALQSMYPELQFKLDATQLNLDSPLEEECAKWEQEQLAAAAQPRKLLGASSHYRRIQALRPVVEFGPSSSDSDDSDSDDSHYHSQRSSSSRSSAYISLAPTHVSEERESARIAALGAAAKGHARKASELSESQWTTDLSCVPRLGHAHMRSDASLSSVSSMSSAGSTWSVPSTQSSDRSRANTLDSSAQPCAEALSLFCLNPDVDVSPPPQVKLAPAPLPVDREHVLRMELAALDAELDATFRAFEYDDDQGAGNINSFAYDLGEGWGHEDPVGWNQGEDNGLGLELGLVGPGSTPMPSCDVFGLAISSPAEEVEAPVVAASAPVSLLAALELQPIATTPKRRARPDLKPIDVAASLATSHSVFEPYSPVLTPPASASKTPSASTFTSLFKRGVSAALSPPPTPLRSSKALEPPTPTRRDSHERELADRLVGRIDAVLRGRWSAAKSPTALKYANSAVESPRRPSLGHKRSRALLSALNA